MYEIYKKDKNKTLLDKKYAIFEMKNTGFLNIIQYATKKKIKFQTQQCKLSKMKDKK